jgi:hypothetical protein
MQQTTQGCGKTTLINHILHNKKGFKILVIENEIGEVGVDNDLLLTEDKEEIILMNNGCICCSVRGDLIKVWCCFHACLCGLVYYMHMPVCGYVYVSVCILSG